MIMVHIEDLVIEQQNKIFGKYSGGDKYGHDYNILKAIMERHKDKVLVKSLVEDLEDKTLKSKVESWMEGVPESGSPAEVLMGA